MNDQRLNELLRSLPRHDSSPGFTGEVMSRLGENIRDEVRFPWAAAAAVIIAVSLAGLTGQRLIENQQRKERLEAIRAEQQLIEERLQELKALTAEAEPLIYLGSDGDVDYLIDLRDVELSGAEVRTASYVRGPQ